MRAASTSSCPSILSKMVDEYTSVSVLSRIRKVLKVEYLTKFFTFKVKVHLHICPAGKGLPLNLDTGTRPKMEVHD